MSSLCSLINARVLFANVDSVTLPVTFLVLLGLVVFLVVVLILLFGMMCGTQGRCVTLSLVLTCIGGGMR